MKTRIACALAVAFGLGAVAHAADGVAAGKPAAPPKSAKPAKPVKATPVAARAAAGGGTSSRTQLHSATTQVAAGIRAAEAALTPEELAIAERVHRGTLPCELGASVQVQADERAPGYFDVQGKGFRYRMHPVSTSTGAVRLEDRHLGAVWLQLANKSMLMDQKAGRRLADECASPAQVAYAESMKLNPPPSLIDTSDTAKK